MEKSAFNCGDKIISKSGKSIVEVIDVHEFEYGGYWYTLKSGSREWVDNDTSIEYMYKKVI